MNSSGDHSKRLAKTFIQWTRFYAAEKYVRPSLASPDRAPIIRDPGEFVET